MTLPVAEQPEITREIHAALAARLNGETWTLLDKVGRTPEEDDRLVQAAYASCYHWLHAGTPLHQQRGQWLIARVHAMLGQAESAVRHARRCRQLTEQHHDLMHDFDLAYAEEAMARALALAGDKDAGRRHKARACELRDAIADAEDKRIFDGDYAAGPWYGI